MGLPTRIRENLLFVAARPSDRLTLYQRAIATVVADNGYLIVLVGAETIDYLRSVIKLGDVDPNHVTAMSVDDAMGSDDPAWRGFCGSVDRLVVEARSRGGERQVTLVVDLDAVFAGCQAASEMMSVVYHLNREHVSLGRTVASVVSPPSLPRSLPPEFFDLYSNWAFGDTREYDGAAGLDRSVEQLALSSGEFRQRFLASARNETALGLVPVFLDDYRRGILIVDCRFTIRFCSPRAANLLGKTADEVVERALSTCIDGVDLVTVKHECEKLTPGRAPGSPFIASWRIAAGVYEPREVSADRVSSGHQTVGYILTVSFVEPVRGPRAVYQQLKQEKATATNAGNLTDDEDPLTHDESVSGDLHGTQITRREHEIILLILKNMTNRQISDHLNIAEVTVKKHLTSVYRKLRITSRRELAVSFARPGSES